MIYLGADHRGYALKEQIRKWLTDWGKEFEDLGAHEPNTDDDYPDIVHDVVEKMQAATDRAILLCGSGIGVAVVANRTKGIRCALGVNAAQIRAGRTDDNVNVLALASDFVNDKEAQDMVKTFLEAPFSGQERYKRRIEKIDSA